MTSRFETDFALADDSLYDHLGTTVTYTPSGGDAAEITAIVSAADDDVDPRDDADAFDRDATRIRVLVLAEDVPAPSRADTLVYDGLTWAVPPVANWKKSTPTDHAILFETTEYVR